ncbi:MAG: tRNA pseudouridine(38-40) synthase TruA [Theionarchaea archaeon]|nr:tRNA pseudouridine(38-40) synthase TruA [Theionarchaea archaeon]
MMLKIAYLGEKFHGFAYQPKMRTVEGDILKALERIGCTTRVYPASRTDKGVSVFSNIIRIAFERDNICRILTALLEDIWAYGYSLEEWNPRHCLKHYIYFLSCIYKSDDLEKCCTLFSGVHDFSAFTRGKYSNTVREIEVYHEVRGAVTLLHFKGKSFLWEMIRRCVTGMKMYLSGEKTEQDITLMLEGKSEKIPAAQAENLILADLEGGKPFLIDQFSLKRMRKEFYSRYELYTLKKAMFESFLDFHVDE